MTSPPFWEPLKRRRRIKEAMKEDAFSGGEDATAAVTLSKCFDLW